MLVDLKANIKTGVFVDGIHMQHHFSSSTGSGSVMAMAMAIPSPHDEPPPWPDGPKMPQFVANH